MALVRTTVREFFRPASLFPETVRGLLRLPSPGTVTEISPFSRFNLQFLSRGISTTSIRCAAAANETSSGGKKTPARLAQVQEFLVIANERAKGAGDEPIPKVTLDHVTVNFARSGGPGGQNVNKVNTKVDMRFNVKDAGWLSERVKERILQKEKNRINKDGELVISSTKTRTQKGNIEDALAKLQVFTRLLKKFQAIIDDACYVPPPPSEETIKKINKLAAIGEQKRLDKKKAASQKKAFRRSRDSWD
ncbi:OLC1v1029411C3 [Oldenlandia corymbosa var. corymbosa]|uniref:OLC1v1029411C3 n=1 Tax=Oldenlandia corymbosa var. corymbosa TaxID=529605 RepID=A0AAV1CH69_OLDCO|nr:OLC1v1029411C3 [Oldenlandia corymbosa var. corymbosa]